MHDAGRHRSCINYRMAKHMGRDSRNTYMQMHVSKSIRQIQICEPTRVKCYYDGYIGSGESFECRSSFFQFDFTLFTVHLAFTLHQSTWYGLLCLSSSEEEDLISRQSHSRSCWWLSSTKITMKAFFLLAFCVLVSRVSSYDVLKLDIVNYIDETYGKAVFIL